jgi:hypothetical protein
VYTIFALDDGLRESGEKEECSLGENGRRELVVVAA